MEAVCRSLPFRFCEATFLELPRRLGPWGFGESLDPADLLLPSLSEVRSTTLRTISLGEFEAGLVGLVSVGLDIGFCKGTSTGFEGGREEWDIVSRRADRPWMLEDNCPLPLVRWTSRRITRYRPRLGSQR